MSVQWHPSRRRPSAVLAARYFHEKVGDLTGVFLLLAQAPLIGGIVRLGFDGAGEDITLRFVWAVVALWFGTFNAAREIVRERPVFLRERRMGVPAGAYLWSKLSVLAVLAALQCGLFVSVFAPSVRLDVAPPTLVFALWLIALAGTSLGLMISALVKTQQAALALVPIALLPQLVFSDLLVPNPSLVVERIEWFLVADWGLALLRELGRDETRWGQAFGMVVALAALSLGQLLIARVKLALATED